MDNCRPICRRGAFGYNRGGLDRHRRSNTHLQVCRHESLYSQLSILCAELANACGRVHRVNLRRHNQRNLFSLPRIRDDHRGGPAQHRIMALPLKYNLRNITVRKSSTIATAFTIGLTVGVYLMVMALARGIDLTLTTSGEPLNLIVLRE